MEVGALREAGIQDDLRASELRQWQLWFLTLGLLLVFGSGAVAGFYFLLDDRVGDDTARQAATPIGVVATLLLASLLYLAVQGELAGAYPPIGDISDTPLADVALAVVPALGVVVAVGGLI